MDLLNNNSPHLSDIYLMRRRKSRAGCLLTIFVLMAVGILIYLFYSLKTNDGSTEGDAVMFEAGAEGAAPDHPLADADYALPPVVADAPPQPPTAVQPPPAPQPQPIAQTQRAVTPNEQMQIAQLLQTARQQEHGGDYQAAREAALSVLDVQPGHAEAEALLNRIAIPLLMSQRQMPEKLDYTVQSGDYLGKLAAKFNTPIDLIAKANNIHGANIRVGDRLRLFDGKNHTFELTVSKTLNTLLVTINGKFFKRYRVGTGEYSKTPVGTFKIVDKISQPVWWRPDGKSIPYGDPENLLGTHWLALDIRGYGLHGTWEPDTIGSQSSAGCVRLLNNEIEELYTILPKGTVVHITD